MRNMSLIVCCISYSNIPCMSYTCLLHVLYLSLACVFMFLHVPVFTCRSLTCSLHVDAGTCMYLHLPAFPILVPCMYLHVPAYTCMYLHVLFLSLACPCMPHLCQDCWGPLQEISAGGAARPVPHHDCRGCVRLVARIPKRSPIQEN